MTYNNGYTPQDDSYDTRPERPERDYTPVTPVEFSDASADGYGSIVAIAMLAVLVCGVIIFMVR